MSTDTTIATPRLSAADLGITEREYTGLIKVRDDLASGRIRHVEVAELLYVEDLNTEDWNSHLFNMSCYHANGNCGAAHCIAGFMQAMGVYQKYNAIGIICSSSIVYLFRPYKIDSYNWRQLTASQAVRAINQFLAGAGQE